jgi:hypothetical protein
MIGRVCGLAAIAASLFCGTAWAGEQEKQTLRDLIAKQGLKADAITLKNLDKPIIRRSELNDATQYVIAYYIDDGTTRLFPPLYVERYDRIHAQWQSGKLTDADDNGPGVDSACLGQVPRIESVGNRLFLDTHINPSAECVLVLCPELKLEASIYGWLVGRIGDEELIYQRSEIHFATVHPTEIAIYDLRTKRDTTLFPHKPDQAIRGALVAQLKQFYETRKDWCNKWNDPCDSEQLDSSLEGKVATSEAEHALAFVISYDQEQADPGGEQKPSGPKQVLYVYRHVNDEAKMEFREMLLSEANRRFGDVPLSDLLKGETLQKIFAGTSQ